MVQCLLNRRGNQIVKGGPFWLGQGHAWFGQEAIMGGGRQMPSGTRPSCALTRRELQSTVECGIHANGWRRVTPGRAGGDCCCEWLGQEQVDEHRTSRAMPLSMDGRTSGEPPLALVGGPRHSRDDCRTCISQLHGSRANGQAWSRLLAPGRSLRALAVQAGF